MKRIANSIAEENGQRWSHYHYTGLGESLSAEIRNRPLIQGEPCSFNRLVIVSKHISGATWIHRGKCSEIQDILGRVLKMYWNGDLSGDVLFYKTQSQTLTESAQYPVTFKEVTGMEYWFVTGMTDMYKHIDEFINGDMSLTNGLMETPLVHTPNKLLEINVSAPEIARSADRYSSRKLWLRANWIRLIKLTLNEDFHNQFYSFIGGRYGYAMYKDGRAYMHQFGSNQMNHKIDVHHNRIINFHMVFPPVLFKDYMSEGAVYEDENGLMALGEYFRERIIPETSPIRDE